LAAAGGWYYFYYHHMSKRNNKVVPSELAVSSSKVHPLIFQSSPSSGDLAITSRDAEPTQRSHNFSHVIQIQHNNHDSIDTVHNIDIDEDDDDDILEKAWGI